MPGVASHWITSGAVPPKTATVRLYQAPMPSPRSSVGNSSLMIAGAMEANTAYRPRPKQNTRSTAPKLAPGAMSFDIGTMPTAIRPAQTSICGLRPKRSAVQPNGYCSATNRAVAIDSAQNTMPSSRPCCFTANGVRAEKNV